MRADLRAVALWSGFLVTLTVVLVGWTRDPLQLALLGGAAAAALIFAVLFAWRRGAREVETIPESSAGALLLGLGIAGALLGSVLGAWLLLPGAGAAVAGLVLVAREQRNEP